MKKTETIISITFVYILFCSLFGSFFINSESDIFIGNILKTPIIFVYLLLFSSILFLLLKKNSFYLVGLIFSVVAFVLLTSLRSFITDSNLYSIGPSLFILFIVSFLIMILLYNLVSTNTIFSIKDIVEIAMFVAIAIVLDLSFFKIRIGQNGGSISLNMLPLFLLSYRKGFVKAFIGSGIIFGFITCLLDGYGFFTYTLDYLLAFGSLAFGGIFRKHIISKDYKMHFKNLLIMILTIILSISFRLIFSTISGIVFYELSFLPSLIYQLTYLLPSSICVLVFLIILYKPLLIVEKLHPSN